MKIVFTTALLLFTITFVAQTDQKIYDIINAVSAERIETDVKKLAGFGTRHTLSDTVSNTRGIGAASSPIFRQFLLNTNAGLSGM